MKVKIWLLEGCSPIPIESTIFPLPVYLKLLEYERRKWMKMEKKDYVLLAIKNGLEGINVKEQNCSYWKITLRRK